ncbi:MAG: hypothetical protein A2007_03215 [Verrucomicrobia bacterium GWC2_42_7]|nr:MAG: hypothetical protein A2007_03215 [Verrucomicrobia bacterium GWC2_42_7]
MYAPLPSPCPPSGKLKLTTFCGSMAREQKNFKFLRALDCAFVLSHVRMYAPLLSACPPSQNPELKFFSGVLGDLSKKRFTFPSFSKG